MGMVADVATLIEGRTTSPQPCWCGEGLRLVTCVNVQGRTPTILLKGIA
jgi:hypothetical protein